MFSYGGAELCGLLPGSETKLCGQNLCDSLADSTQLFYSDREAMGKRFQKEGYGGGGGGLRTTYDSTYVLCSV